MVAIEGVSHAASLLLGFADDIQGLARFLASPASKYMTGASLTVVTTWEVPPTFGWAPPYPSDFDPDKDARKALRRAQAHFDGLCNDLAALRREEREA